MRNIIGLLLCICLAAGTRFQPAEIAGFEKSIRGIAPIDVTLNDRGSCLDGLPDGDQPGSRGNTTEEVAALILEMVANGFDGYIIPSADAHQSEYTAAADLRRQYITAFTGSAGTAVILADGRRALWTDSRYFLQGDYQLDCSWLLMKSGEQDVPSINEWLIDSLASGSVVSADARLIGADAWLSAYNDLTAAGLVFIAEEITDGNNILDVVWNSDGRPAYSLDEVFIHDIQYAGATWQSKVNDVVAEMEANGAEAIILSTLDETAWLLNLRGSDIPFNPFFRSYIIIDNSGGGDPSLILFVPDEEIKLPDSVREHLLIDQCNSGEPILCVSLGIYNSIGQAVSDIAAETDSIWLTTGVSYYIYNSVPAEKIIYETSPVMFMKAMKNDAERDGMRNAHIRDGVAVVAFLAKLEADIDNGTAWTELEASIKVAEYRVLMENSMGSSFESISAFGPNGAIVHYAPTAENNFAITNESIYLLDSGGQYLDGTTDITRTVHFGEPTAYQIETYTLVLQGMIDYADAVFPVGTLKSHIDVLARQHLYRKGLNFEHGTAHGIGAFGGVHEGGASYFESGFHQSDEPGYYEDGQFGIRIENVVAIIDAETDHGDEASYKFETLTLVPYEPSLIDTSALTKRQCEWLNAYNNKVVNVVGSELQRLGYDEAYDWMISKTAVIAC